MPLFVVTYFERMYGVPRVMFLQVFVPGLSRGEQVCSLMIR